MALGVRYIGPMRHRRQMGGRTGDLMGMDSSSIARGHYSAGDRMGYCDVELENVMNALQRYSINFLATSTAKMVGTSLPTIVAKIQALVHNSELTGTQKRAIVEDMVIQGATGLLKIIGQLAVMLALAWAANNGKIEFTSDGKLVAAGGE